MEEFILFFRRDVETVKPGGKEQDPKVMQELGKKWWEWKTKLDKENRQVGGGNRMSRNGKVVKADGVVTDGPYAELKEALAGYVIINAADFDEAVAIAKECPVLLSGGNVEVRKFIDANDNAS